MAVVVNNTQLVSALYVAIFNRAPDKAGLDSWVAQMAAGKSFADVSTGFTGHEVFTQGIGTLGNAAFINALYTNVLGSAGDAAGVAGWVALLNGGASKASIAASFVQAALTVDIPALLASGALTAADAAAAQVRQDTLTNKANVGIYFTTTLGAASNLNPLTVSSSKAGLEADPIYNASKAAIAGVTNTAASVQTAKDAIAVAAGSTNPAQSLLGGTFTLTTGADTLVGGSSADVFTALSVKADGTAGTTLSAFDSIDGGAGNDTLNIYSDGATNTAALSASATVKNVETININNSGAGFGAVDASKFVGATTINQAGIANDVSSLTAGTTASFSGLSLSSNAKAGVAGTAGSTVSTTASAISVAAGATATNAAVALNGVKGDTATVGATSASAYNPTGPVPGVAGVNATVQNQAALNVSGAALNSVNVSGTVAQATTTVGAAAATLALNVTAGQDVQSLAVNTAVATTLTAINAGGKVLTGVDASASIGAINYAAGTNAIATIKTGAGNDTVSIQTVTSNTVGAVVDALVATGAGNDKITLSTSGTGKTTVDAGQGDDTITLTSALTTSTRIDGGAGTDKLVLSNGGTLVAGDYALIGSTVSNVEKLAFGAAAVADASKLAQFSELTFSTGTNTVTAVAAAQALIATGNLTASAAGYVLDSDAVLTGNQTTYAGTLNVTSKAALAPDAQAIVVNADAATVTVAAGSGTTAGSAASQGTTNIATITGDVKTLSVVTANGVNNADLATAAAKADTLSVATVTVDATHLAALTTLTLSGNGSITLDDSAAATGTIKLATIDASALGGTLAYGANAGNVTGGLIFTGNAFVAETIKLGAGSDVITVNSTYGKMDTISGFDSVKETNTAKSTTDVLKFSTLDTSIVGVGANAVATKVALSSNATTVELAFVEAAAASGVTTNTTAGSVVFFQLGGDTYLFQDSAAASGSTNQKVLDAGDLAVKLVGVHNFAVDFDAFVAA